MTSENLNIMEKIPLLNTFQLFSNKLCSLKVERYCFFQWVDFFLVSFRRKSEIFRNVWCVHDMFSRIPNLRIFFTKFFLFSFKTRQNSSIEIINVDTFMITKKTLSSYLKENKKFFARKNCSFVDSEFVKTCHEQVIQWLQKLENERQQ